VPKDQITNISCPRPQNGPPGLHFWFCVPTASANRDSAAGLKTGVAKGLFDTGLRGAEMSCGVFSSHFRLHETYYPVSSSQQNPVEQP
jgi:hypothetical protein